MRLNKEEWITIRRAILKILLAPFVGAGILVFGTIAVMSVIFLIFTVPFPILSIGMIAESGFSDDTKNILGAINLVLTCGFWGVAVVAENNN